MKFARHLRSVPSAPVLSAALASLFVTSPVAAAPTPPRVLVETDPVTFVMGGYAAHVRIPVPDTGFVVGAGLYGMQLPSFVAELHPDNAGEGYHLEIDKSYAAFVDYHFDGKPEGFFVGVQTALQRHRVTQGGDPAATEIGVALVMPRIGYLLRPFEGSGFYLLPWAGAGPALEVYRTNSVAENYESLPVLAFGTLHVGWAFE